MRFKHVGGKRNRLINLIVFGAIALAPTSLKADNQKVNCSLTATYADADRNLRGEISFGDSIVKDGKWVLERPLVFSFPVENPTLNGGCPPETSRIYSRVIGFLSEAVMLCIRPSDAEMPGEGEKYPCVPFVGHDLTSSTTQISPSTKPYVEALFEEPL